MVCLSGITQGNVVYSQYSGGTTGYLQLTSSALGQSGYLYWTINPGNSFSCTFEFFTGGGSGADELGFYFGGTAAPSGTYATVSNGYTIVYQEWTSNSGPGIYIYYNNVQLAFYSTATLGNSTWHTTTITFFRNQFRISYDGTTVINYFDTTNRTMTLPNIYMGFNGSTGGLGNNHLIRNIRIAKFNEGLWQYQNQTSSNIMFSGNVYSGTYTAGGAGSFTGINAYPTNVISSGVNGNPATSSSVGNAIVLRLRGADDAVLDMGVNSSSGTWLQSTNYMNYSTSYPLFLNPNGGNVGINTSTPGVTLDVTGSARFTVQVSTGSLFSTNLTSSVAAISTLVGNAGTQTSNDTLYIGNANFFIDRPSGNTGGGIIFGFNTPKTLASRVVLAVFNNSTDRNSLLNIYSKGASGSDLIQINTFLEANSNSNTLGNLFTTGGNIGINTNTPLGGLDVNSANGANSWSYFRGNANAVAPSSSFIAGLAIAWNPSAGGGETQLLYGTSTGADP